MLHALCSRGLAIDRCYLVKRKRPDLVPVAKVPDCVDDGTSIVGGRVCAAEVAGAVFRDHDERFTRKARVTDSSGTLPKSLPKIPVLDVGEVINAKAVDMVLSHPEFRHLIEEFARRKIIAV